MRHRVSPDPFKIVKAVRVRYGVPGVDIAGDRADLISMSKRLCTECNRQYEPNDYRQRFCSRSCAATANNRRGVIGRAKRTEWTTCNGCSERLPKLTSKYCSVKCRREHIVASWLSGETSTRSYGQVSDVIRAYLLDRAEHKCPQCGWSEIHPITGRVPLEVDHIDGNSSNNEPKNLRILCPNCHSLTPTFRRLNKKGRQRKASALTRQ